MEPIRIIEAGIPLERGPAKGPTALFLSDTHIRRETDLDEIKAVVRANPADLLLLGGDLIERRRLVRDFARVLSAEDFPLGAFAVLGNNDSGLRKTLLSCLPAAGIEVLEDSARRLAGGLYIIGTKDPHYGRPDPAAAIGGVPSDAALLVLAHSPDIIRKWPRERPATILAGHTHGGQVAFPRLGPLWSNTRIGKRYISGLHEIGRISLFVGRGTGRSGIPFRNVPREAYLVRFEGTGACALR